MALTLTSWNVNGIRAAHGHGMLTWLAQAQPDIFCVQEIKAMPEQLSADLTSVPGYHVYWQPAARKGYSGVATYTKQAPAAVEVLGAAEFDVEGRAQLLHYADFSLLNAYFPNSQPGGARLDYKLAFCEALLTRCAALTAVGRSLIVCGDFNIAHRPIDLKNPRRNEQNPGYLPEERAWMDRFLAAGYRDTFRLFCADPGHYTWWSYRFKARARNIGWRIDYFCVDAAFASQVSGAGIDAQVMGSDHCPVWLRLG